MMVRLRTTAALVVSLVTVMSFATAAVQASENSEREKQTSGVTPDKTNSSAGEAKREGTGEGRATPADKAPTTSGNR